MLMVACRSVTETDRQADRQTGRQTDRQTDRDRDIQTRQIEADRGRQTEHSLTRTGRRHKQPDRQKII